MRQERDGTLVDMKITGFALVAPAALAAAIALPGTAHAGVHPTFESPSHDIRCWVSEKFVTCGIVEQTYARSGACPEGQQIDAFLLRVGEPARVRCSAPKEDRGLRTTTVLDYGQSLSRGPMTCTSELDGVTCTDTGTGHFFRVSKESYELS